MHRVGSTYIPNSVCAAASDVIHCTPHIRSSSLFHMHALTVLTGGGACAPHVQSNGGKRTTDRPDRSTLCIRSREADDGAR